MERRNNLEKKKGTCSYCGKQNVTTVYVKGDSDGLHAGGWFCWKCAEKLAGIKPKEKRFSLTIGDILKEKGITLPNKGGTHEKVVRRTNKREKKYNKRSKAI